MSERAIQKMGQILSMEAKQHQILKVHEHLLSEVDAKPFTTAMADRTGVSGQQLSRMKDMGLIRHIAHGVWSATNAPDTVETRIAALKLVVPNGAVVCDEAAGWVHGANRILAPNAHLEVPRIQVFLNQTHHRLRRGVTASGQRVMPERHIAIIDGLAVTTPLRTACDLGRLRHPDWALAALDSLLRLGDFTRDELLDEIGLFRGYRHVIQLRRLAPLADPRSESPGESALRLRWLSIPGAPPPELQIEVRREYGSNYFLDLGCEELGYAAEYDGEAYHSATPSQVQHDLRRREECAVLGWDLDVFTKANTFGPRQDAAETIASGLARATRRTGG